MFRSFDRGSCLGLSTLVRDVVPKILKEREIASLCVCVCVCRLLFAVAWLQYEGFLLPVSPARVLLLAVLPWLPSRFLVVLACGKQQSSLYSIVLFTLSILENPYYEHPTATAPGKFCISVDIYTYIAIW